MAIIIPSKKLYDVQSPQIRKNAVKGITIDLINDKSVDSNKNNNVYDYVITTDDITTKRQNLEQDLSYRSTDITVNNNTAQSLRFVSAYSIGDFISEGSVEIDRYGDNYYIVSAKPKLNLEVSIYKATTQAYLNRKTFEVEFMTYSPPALEYSLVSVINNFDFSTQLYENIENKNSDVTTTTNITTDIQTRQDGRFIVFSVSTNYDSMTAGNKESHHTITFPLLTRSATSNPLSGLEYSINDKSIKIDFSYANNIIIEYLADVFDASVANNGWVDCDRYELKVTKATLVLNETIRRIDSTDKKQTITTSATNGSTISVSKNQFIKIGLFHCISHFS
jgi:hypothetical protein